MRGTRGRRQARLAEQANGNLTPEAEALMHGLLLRNAQERERALQALVEARDRRIASLEAQVREHESTIATARRRLMGLFEPEWTP